MAKTIYINEWLSYIDLIEKMEEMALAQTDVSLKFSIGMEDDGSHELYVDWGKSSYKDILKLVEKGWLYRDLIEEIQYLERDTEEDRRQIEWILNSVIVWTEFFEFVLRKTFGNGTIVIETKEERDGSKLNVAVPAKYKLFKSTNLL